MANEKLKEEFRGAPLPRNPGSQGPDAGHEQPVRRAMGEEAVSGDPVVRRNQFGNDVFVTDAGAALVERLATHGCSFVTMAKALGVAESTFREIRKRQPEVAEAAERGYSAMEDEIVSGLMARFRQGHLETRDRGALTAGIFLLKSRRGYEGVKLPAHITINQDNRQQTIALPSADEMASYMQRVAETA